MQGYTHALTGSAGWLALTTSFSVPIPEKFPELLPTIGGAALPLIGGASLPLSANPFDASLQTALAGSVLCAGGALAADMDHHNGTIAHSLPPLTGVACRVVSIISGGHRHGTHSLIGIAAFMILTWLASFVTIEVEGRTVALGAGLIAVPLVAFAMKGLGVRLGSNGSILNTFLGPWIVSVGTAGLATYYVDYQWTWLPLAVGLGVFSHILGDMLTTQGVPWLWPWNPSPPKSLTRLPAVGTVTKIVWQNNGYFRVHVLGTTTSTREVVFSVLVAVHVLYLLAMVTLAL